MPMGQIPAVLVALCLSIYWASVVVLGIRLRRKIGKGPNAIPPDPVGLLMRAFWMPAIVLQILHAWLIGARLHWPFTNGGVPKWAVLWGYLPQPAWWPWVALGAAVVVALCLSLTFVCWKKMGKNWRIGIDRGEKLEFISTGPYNLVRHPIYALRMLLDIGAIVAVPTAFMAAVTAVDILLLAIEARREERYMESTHGQAYVSYKRRVGRFLPQTRIV
jgi:protein-S-isoprenylcysteine O-methyltransferase Ste14